MRQYRITEKIYNTGKIEFVPECCEYIEKRLLGKNKEHWHNIGNNKHQQNDTGYATIEEAQEKIVAYERIHHNLILTKSVIHEIKNVKGI
jgi:ribonuclease D